MQEKGDFTPAEHIAVLSSHRSGTKLLGTTSLKRGTGRDQAAAIKNILNAWNLEEQSVAMCSAPQYPIQENLMAPAFFGSTP